MKRESLQPRILSQAEVPFSFEGGTKSFKDKQKLKEFSIGFTRNVKGTSLNRKEKTQLEI